MHLVADMALRLSLQDTRVSEVYSTFVIREILSAEDVILTLPRKTYRNSWLVVGHGKEPIDIASLSREYRDTIRKLFKSVGVQTDHIYGSREVQFKDFHVVDTYAYHQ